jgi:hypothetical protein
MKNGLPFATLLLWKVLRAVNRIFMFRTIPRLFVTVTQLKLRLFIDRVLEYVSYKFMYFIRGFYRLVVTCNCFTFCPCAYVLFNAKMPHKCVNYPCILLHVCGATFWTPKTNFHLSHIK